MSLRKHTLLVSDSLYRDLQTVADLSGHGNAESVAEAWLAERLEGMPEIALRRKMIAEAVRAAIKDWEARP